MKQKGHYLSVKESRAIIRHNIKQMKYYEAEKRKPRTLAEYTAPMRDNNNLIEIDSLKTCFFTDTGTVMSVNGVSFDIPKGKIFDCVKALKEVEVAAPVHIGDVVLADVAGTGVDVIATKNVPAV